MRDFHEGLAMVKKNGICGFVDKTGKVHLMLVEMKKIKRNKKLMIMRIKVLIQ